MNFSPQYVAGLFDGEGHFCINRLRDRYFIARAEIHMGERSGWLLRDLHEQFAGSLRKSDGNAIWTLTGKNCRKFLSSVGPYMVLKAPHVELLKRFFDLGKISTDVQRGDADAMRLSLHTLNLHKGKKIHLLGPRRERRLRADAAG